MNSIEMKVLRSIKGVSVRNTKRNEIIREQRGIQNISRLMKTTRKQWDQHIDRMDAERLLQIWRQQTIQQKTAKKNRKR